LTKGDIFDVVVVGAGPAGSMAARAAASEGARTVLLEKHAEVGRPVCCAEGITTFGLERVIKPRPEWIANVIEGASLTGPDGRVITVYHPRAGYVLDRAAFDKGLAEAAVESGAELLISAPAVTLEMRDRIGAVIVDLDGTKRRIEGRIFIAADGVESRIAHMAGIDTTLSLNKIDSACQYLVENIAVDEKMISILIGNKTAPGGYAWVFPKKSGCANVGVSICPARSDGQTARGFLDCLLKARFPTGRIAKIMVGGVPAFDRNMPMVLGNLMIVGDAARLLDSLSGAGISNALLSGQIAGEVASKYLKGQGGLKEYPRRFMKLKARELHAYRLFKSIFLRASDRELCRILDAVDDYFPEKKVRDINFPDIILKLVFRNLDLVKMARHLIVC